MVLLHLVKACGVPLTVLHVNYHLRGEESQGDEAFVKNHCKTHQLPFDSLQSPLAEILATNKGNLQNEARKIRYAFFKSHVEKIPGSYLLTAHHLEDQIETFWLQLFRGSGISGMAGMAAKNDFILRPLRSYSKAEIRTYAQHHQLDWREDSSNQDPKYFRNFFRLEALPYLREQCPTLDEAVLLLQKVFQEELLTSKSIAVTLSDKWMNDKRMEFADFSNTSIVLHEAMKRCNIPSVHFQSIVDLVQAEKGKKTIIQNPSSSFKEIVKESTYLAILTDFAPVQFSIQTEVVTSLPQFFNQHEWYLDARFDFEHLALRTWRAGDKLRPIGLKGSKKVSDILKDFGIESHKKQNHPIAVLNDDIVGIPGVCLSQKYAATKEAQRIIKVTFVSC